MVRIRELNISIDDDSMDKIKEKIIKKYKLNKDDIKNIKIVKKSIDARRKNNVHYVYELDISLENEDKILKFGNAILSPNEDFVFNITGKEKMNKRIVIVGSGPAGLFCAYILAENGYKPLVIERGEKVEDRVKTVNKFFSSGILSFSSNVQFGEGGAGTFSDGKLNTLVKDKEFIGKKVFEIFVKNGAPSEIMYENNPHIGTDILVDVVKNIRNDIISMGGEFSYNSCLTDLIIEDNKLKQIVINNSDIIECDNLILAIGHSARDTFKMLYEKGICMSPKSFAVGIRIQHPQEFINKNQYGEFYKKLPPANYKLTYKSKSGRGVYSFCMCPGGYVVNSSSEEGRLVINGMSNYKRDSINANSALVVTVSETDFGFHPLDGLKFQQTLEEAAFKCGKGKIPTQLLSDFYENKISDKIKSVNPVFKGDYNFSNINDILPKYICDDLKEAIKYFDTKIKGYNMNDAIISAVESRTSSPIRIKRDELYMSNIKGIYPIGEGAGYSGGITTSAMDGVRMAKCIAKIYRC